MHYRADQASASAYHLFVSQSDKVGIPVKSSGADSLPSQINYATSTTFNNLVIEFEDGTQTRGIHLPGGKNLPSGKAISIVMRFIPGYAAPPWTIYLFTLSSGGSGRTNYLELRHHVNGIECYARGQDGLPVVTGITAAAAMSFGGAYTDAVDLGMSWAGTTTADLEFYVNGTLTTSFSVPSHFLDDAYNNWQTMKCVDIGQNAVSQAPSRANYHLEEFAVFDTALEGITTTRSDFFTGTSFDGSVNSDPGIANVLSATEYIIGGVTLTGTYNPPAASVSTDPGVANVLSGTGYTIEDTSFTGTLVGTTSVDPGESNVLSGTGYTINDTSLTGTYTNSGGTYTDPGLANVRLATEYIFNDATLTGTLVAPAAASGLTSTVDLPNILAQIKYVLDQANTTSGADPFDLSSNMQNRVQKVLKYNLEKIQIQPSYFPAVTTFIEGKSIESQSIAGTQRRGKRKATVSVAIAGIVYENRVSNDLEDAASQDLEYLMENVELVLRSYADLSQTVKWQIPNDVDYFPVGEEEALLRVGVISMNVIVFY